MNTVTKFKCVLQRVQLVSSINYKNFHVSAVTQLKEIQREDNNGNITIRGVAVKSPREGKLLKLPYKTNSGKCLDCPICKLGPTIHIKHTDVLILKQFVSSDGRILPRDVSGLCFNQQRYMNYLIIMARHAGLLPKYLPDGTVDPTESTGWRANNKYYDESTIEDMMFKGRRKA